MCIVVDLDVVCLVCLHHSQKMHGIFEPDTDASDIQIAHKISTLSKIKVSADNETLPHKICETCLEDLRAAWRFHKNCQTAVLVFQSILRPKHKQGDVEATSTSKAGIVLENNAKIDVIESSEDYQQIVLKLENADDSINEVYPNDPSLDDMQDSDIHEALEQADTHKDVDSIMEEAEGDYLSDTIDEEGDLVEYFLTVDGIQENLEEDTKKPSCSNLLEKPQTSNTASNSLLKSKIQQNIETKKLQQTSQAYTSQHQDPPSHSKPQSRVKIKTEVQIIKSEQITDDSQNNVSDNDNLRKRNSKGKLLSNTKAPKICEICGNSYRYQHALSAHMRRHYQDKPFPCELCDKAFVSNVELRRHIRVHTGHKPYACQYCDRRFSDFGSRIKHERTHTGERPYKCTTCGKSFAYPHVLSVHLRTHTGEKRFQCEFCPKGFTKKAYLLSHTNQHHVDHESKMPLTISELSIDGSMTDDGREESEYEIVKKIKIDGSIYSTEYESERCDDPNFEGNEENVEDPECIGLDDGDSSMLMQEDIMNTNQESPHDDEEHIEEGDDIVELKMDPYTLRRVR